MENQHFIGHQQVLIKDKLVIAVLVFNEHNEDIFKQTFSKFEYDEIVDLCKLQEENKDTSTGIGFSWDGQKFHYKPFESWTLGEDAHWHPPVARPEGDYDWNEATTSWEVGKKSGKEKTCVTGDCD
jgi:hypothetical protein